MTPGLGYRVARTAALAGLAAGLAGGCTTGGSARPEAPPLPPAATVPSPAPPAPVTMTPARLDAYILAVQNIRATHPAFLQEGSAGADEVVEEMRGAVAQAGLTLEEFRSLHRQVQADPALRAEVHSRLAASEAPAPGGAGASGAGAPGPVAPPAVPAPTPGPY